MCFFIRTILAVKITIAVSAMTLSPTVNPIATSINNLFVSGTVKERTSCTNSPTNFTK